MLVATFHDAMKFADILNVSPGFNNYSAYLRRIFPVLQFISEREINFHKHQNFHVYIRVSLKLLGGSKKRHVAIPKNPFLISLCNNTFQAM